MLPFSLFSQVVDDFGDGDFTSNPQWNGETGLFKISTYSSSTWSEKPRLQLNGVEADSSFLQTSNIMTTFQNKQWDIWVRLAFNTSKSNNCRIYIASDSPNLEGNLNGYFIMLGDDSNDQTDSISFWKQTGTTITKLISGKNAYTAASGNYRVKMINENGIWYLFSDATGGFNFLPEGSCTDNTFNSSAYFGVFCKYTATNKSNFYFDDIYAGPKIVDTVAPQLISVFAETNTKLYVAFSEKVETVSAEMPSNYSVPGIGVPATANKDSLNGSIVILTFATPFTDGVVYNLQVSNISDLNGNQLISSGLPFVYYLPQPFDVVFNEIMADPTPVVGLPEHEYIELKNNTLLPLSLKNWSLTIGSSTSIFPDVTINPDDYLILCSASAVSSLSVHGNTVGFSSFSLTNSGTSLILQNSHGDFIHYLAYTDGWYGDPAKDDGGWSLEQKDPNNPCSGSLNWTASVDNSGGTPGNQNSVFMPNQDTVSPDIAMVRPVNLSRVDVYFTEPLQQPVDFTNSDFVINQGIGNPLSVSFNPPQNNKLVLMLPALLQENLVYQITYNGTLFDCSGNSKTNITKEFVLYQAKQHDIIINEIMADPDPVAGLPSEEYVELFNRTAFPISLSGWQIAFSGSKKFLPDVSIDANGYLILTPDGGNALFNHFGKVAEVQGLSISNDGQVIELLDTNSRSISFVNFSTSWYGSSYKDDGGWSLERIDPNNPCGERPNWKASNDIMGGTPGKINSVNGSFPDNQEPLLIRASINRNEPNHVKLYFNESLDSVGMKQFYQYEVNHGVGNPYFIKLSYPDNRVVSLFFTSPFQEQITYTVCVSDSIFDCAGNKLRAMSCADIAIPETPDSGDIIINEILFDPKDDGNDYVEIFNRSAKILDIKDLVLGNASEDKTITNDNYLLFPKNYLVLTSDQEMVKKQYSTPNIFQFIDMFSFPTYANEDGYAVLKTHSGSIIDAMSYSDKMHFPLLNSFDGVSLERIDFERSSYDLTNWHSAAETAGFGTPAYLNSQYSAANDDDGAVVISPEIFSPDNDGYNDVLNITCHSEGVGKILNVVIYDSKGRLVKNLVKSNYFAGEKTFTWDGTTENRLKANYGIYIVYVELTDASGKVKHYKRTAVLAVKF